ncbi:hypothetical protein ABPG74_014317 [Tetrahymena malaccensis]
MVFYKNILLVWTVAFTNLVQGAEKYVLSELLDNFSQAGVQWVSNNVQQCQNTDFTEYANQNVMGIFGYGLDTSQKTFSGLPPHWSVSIRFDLILYRSLDPPVDYINVTISGETDKYLKDGAAAGYFLCIPSNTWADQLVLFYKNLTHQDSFIDVKIQSKTDEAIRQCLEDCPVSFYKNTDINECLILLNSSCVNECPQNYYTVNQNESKQCFECHRYCKLGCTGPYKEDCYSINYQYQIIIFIFIGQSTIWIVSSIVGYFLDLKQSKVFNSTFFSPRLVAANDEKAQKASLKQENDNQIQTKSLNNDFEQKYTQKENQSSQLNQLNQLNLFNQEQYPQDENYTQNFLEQIMQSHIKTNSLIPTQNNRIYQNSIQNLQYEQTNQESNQLSQTKISSQYIPTIGTISNFNQANNQKVLDKQGEANSAQQQPKYKADNKFKFAILGNEWVSLFYFYDPESTRFTRAIMIFLKYQAFFLSSELVYSEFCLLSFQVQVFSSPFGLFLNFKICIFRKIGHGVFITDYY